MRIQGEFFTINASTTTLKSNIDIIVSTKVSKKAVVRNRLRRQVREILRSYRQNKDLNGLNLKVIVLVKAVGAKFTGMRGDLEHILDKIR